MNRIPMASLCILAGLAATACGAAGSASTSVDTAAPTTAPSNTISPSTTSAATTTVAPATTAALTNFGEVTISPGDGCQLSRDDGAADAVAPGQLLVTVANETEEVAAVEFFKLEGHSFDDLTTHVTQEVDLAEQGEPFIGPPSWARFVSEGTGLLAAGESKDVVIDGSRPGDYGIVCFRPYPKVTDSPVRPFAAVGPFTVGG